jgi:hypothetical protein
MHKNIRIEGYEPNELNHASVFVKHILKELEKKLSRNQIKTSNNLTSPKQISIL